MLNALLKRDKTTGRIMAGPNVIRGGGMNVFQLIANDYPSNRLMSTAEIDSLLNKCVTLKATFIRSHTLGANAGPGSWNLVTGVTGTGANPTVTYNAAVWARMDYAIAKAGQLGLYVMPVMFDQAAVNFGNPFGGSLLTWLRFRTPGLAQASWEQFYTDAQCLFDQRKFLSDFANRVNTVNGLRYADDPTLWAWETGNEMWRGDTYRTWITDTAAAMKAAAPTMLVSDGTAADISSYWRQSGQDGDPVAHVVTSTALASEHVDIVGIHPYVTATRADVEVGIQRAAAAGKCFILGEYAWSKATAPEFEGLVRSYPNALTSMPWSLQNDADLHNNGAAYGTDDVSLYVPGKDATQTAAVARLTAHGTTLRGTAAAAVDPLIGATFGTSGGNPTGDYSAGVVDFGPMQISRQYVSGALPAAFVPSFPSSVRVILSMASSVAWRTDTNFRAYVLSLPASTVLTFAHHPERRSFTWTGAQYVAELNAFRAAVRAIRIDVPVWVVSSAYQYRVGGNGEKGTYLTGLTVDGYAVDTYRSAQANAKAASPLATVIPEVAQAAVGDRAEVRTWYGLIPAGAPWGVGEFADGWGSPQYDPASIDPATNVARDGTITQTTVQTQRVTDVRASLDWVKTNGGLFLVCVLAETVAP